MAMPTTTRRRSATRFTVPEVWRTIVKKNERHGKGLFDVLVCAHAVPANDNTYRRARACPTCRERAQQYADEWQRAASADVAEGAA
jgi:hypothetical protein